VRELGINQELPNSGAYRMSGGTTSINEMIATTRRGILVTRFSHLHIINSRSLLSVAYTRDGTWLIEDGKIKHPV
jgi:predicted Zn-dependent protease